MPPKSKKKSTTTSRRRKPRVVPPSIPEGDDPREVDEDEEENEEKDDDESTALEVSVSEIPTKEPDIPWADSQARRLLVQDLFDGTVPPQPDPSFPTKLIFTSRPEFAEYGYRLFSSRLSSLRKIVKRDKTRADADEECFKEYRSNNTIHTHSPHGYPEWDESVAQKRLQQDIDLGILEYLTPAELWCFREEYDPYPLKVFRDHIAQEVRTRKFYHSLKVIGKSKMKGGVKAK